MEHSPRRPARARNDSLSRSYVNQHNEELEPGDYHLAVQFEDPESGHLSVYKSRLHIRHFPKEDLAVSDVQFAHRVHQGAAGEYVKANNIQVVPYISRIISRERPIMIYFEVYNLLLNPQGRSQFQISYRINHSDESGNIILDSAAKLVSFIMGKHTSSTGSSFDVSGDSMFEQIYTTLDFSSSQRGNKELTVTVKDLISGDESTITSVFKLN